MNRISLKAATRTLLALILAVGLMIPMQSFAAGSPSPLAPDATAHSSADPTADQPAGQVEPMASDADHQAGQAEPETHDVADQSESAVDEDSTELKPLAADAATERTAEPGESTDQPVAPLATAGPFTVDGGVPGTDYSFSGSTLTILSSTPLTISNANATNNNIQIAAGVHANLTLAGVNISKAAAPAINLITNITDTASGAAATDGSQIINPTSLYLKIKDGTTNTLTTTEGSNNAGIRCGEGSILVIDDELDNRLQGGGEASVSGEKVVADVTLVGGKHIAAGSPSTDLDSSNPGTLSIIGGGYAPGIGGSPYENGGTMTFNGGVLDVRTYGWNFAGEGGASYSAGIGAAGSSDGTATVMTFNGGRISAYGGLHGAGIGAGHSGWDGNVGAQQPNSIRTRGSTRCTGDNPNVAGNIDINGGFIYSHGGWHGGAFGSACWSSNKGKTIRITGGTLIPIAGTGAGGAHTGDYNVFPEIGGSKGYVEITGGSVRCSDPSTRFQGLGNTAWGNDAYSQPGYNVSDANDPNKVFLVKIDLSSEIKKLQPDGTTIGGNNAIKGWELLVAGQKYSYGAPQEFDDGKLYLWLPKSATSEQVTVNLTYIDENGQETAIEPLFRNPGDVDVLKRYVEFNLPEEFRATLTKDYDGLPFVAHDIKAFPVVTDEVPAKTLDDPSAVEYVYQRYAEDGKTLVGPEIKGELPSDAGQMKLTMTSTQFSDEATDGFRENYWGHRAFGVCTINRVPSQVELVQAEWVSDKKPGHDEHDARQEVAVTADISGGYFDEEKTHRTADTCKAPTGSVQLYVDDVPVGSPVPLRFEDEKLEDGTVLPKNAEAVDNGKGGSYTRFNYVFTPADADFHVPNETSDNSHKVTVHYLGGLNYLASANPTEDDQAPSAQIKVKPVDPTPSLTPDPSAPPASIETGTPQTGTDTEGDDPIGKDGKEIHGSILLRYSEPSEDGTQPGKVILLLKTPSSAPVTVKTADGTIVEAKLLTDEDGQPLRDADGNLQLELDPKAVGKTQVTITQGPNGAYTGTRFIYDVKVIPDPAIPPKSSAAKTAKNLTHPNGPVQPGDRILFELTAANTAAGSVWKNVVASDTLPQGLALDEASVHLTNSAYGLDQVLVKAPGATSTLGQFALLPGANGRVQFSAAVGDVGGGSSATVSFTCTVLDTAVGLDITNVGNFKGGRLDPDSDPADPDAPVISDDQPTPTDPAYPEGGPRVTPGDSAAKDLVASKSVANQTRSGSDRTRLGDVLRYTITLRNVGPTHTSVNDVLISDPLPRGLDFIAGSIKLIDADGKTHNVPDSAWYASSRTLSVYAGSIPGGKEAKVVFDAKVTPDALSANIANVAVFSGDMPSKNNPESHDPGTPGPDPKDKPVPSPDKPGTDPSDPDGPNGSDDPSNPGDPSNPSDPDDPNGPSDPEPPIEFVLVTPESSPDPVVPDDPQDGDVTATKTAQNLTRGDGTTHVGDTIRYTIDVTNSREHTSWMNVVVRDDVPRGLEPLAGSIKLTLSDGTEAQVPESVYNRQTRTLSINVGDLPGGKKATVTFETLVTEEAIGADIGNVATAYGELPTDFDLNGEKPTPGTPAIPGTSGSPADWDTWTSDRSTVSSPASYAPGTDSSGGTLPSNEQPSKEPSDGPDDAGGATDNGTGADGGAVDDGLANGNGAGDGTADSLAKTGDEAPMLALLLAALAAGALAWHVRRTNAKRAGRS